MIQPFWELPARKQEFAMPTTPMMPTALDRLHEMSILLRQLLSLDDDALQATLREAFSQSPPAWVDRLPREYWATSLVGDIQNSSALLDQRLTPPGLVRSVHASANMEPITIRAATPEEKEALRRVREDSGLDEQE